MRAVWTPEDTVALRRLADEFPREIGESALLAEWVDQFTPSAERWLAVPGYEGAYEVSDCGRVRSLDRLIVSTDGRTVPAIGRELVQTKPYKVVTQESYNPADRWIFWH